MRQSDRGAYPSARVSKRKASTLNTNLASSFRPLPVGRHSYLFQWMTSTSTSVYCWFSLRSLFLSVAFVQECSIRFVQLVTLKVWWSIWHLLACHRFPTFVHKNRQLVRIYSKVIQQQPRGSSNYDTLCTLWVKKKGVTLTIAITLSILDRFAKFFHCCKEQ